MARRPRRLQFILAWLIGMAAACAWAGPYDPPASYYSGATGTATDLKNQLATIMTTGQDLQTYGDARYILDDTDEDPANPNNVLLVYNRNSVSGTWVGNGTGVFGSREHVWPQSRFPAADDDINNGETGIGSDLHMLKPSDPGTNGNRGNRAFAYADTTGANRQIDQYYFPGMADRGDIARILFYAATRWQDKGLTLVEGAGVEANQEMGDLASLLAWHYLDVPDTFELRRNHLIYGAQDNRNAYIDRPEYVWSVYKNTLNDSQLYVGGAPDPNGGSTLNLDLGPVIVGATLPGNQNVTLHKNGFDGTYYEITASGNATSSVTGRYNAFKINTLAADSRTLSVGLDPNAVTTSSAGLKSGSVVVNNLDVTTDPNVSSGRGAHDQNDTINVSLAVYDHANPSFLTDTDQSMWTLDFGAVTLGGTLSPLDFGLSNLAAPSGFTADLELDNFSGSGDTTVFDLALATFTGGAALPPGGTNNFSAMFDTSTLGSFSATYTLNFSDEDLPGATSLGSLTLNLLGEVTAPVENADFNGDEIVDGLDFLIWQVGFGVGTTLAEGDANDDNVVDAEDLDIWETQYGAPPLAAIVTVPEPSAALIAMLLPLLSSRCRMRFRPRG